MTELIDERPTGCILIGGKSRRMGSPKHLLPVKNGRKSWLEHIALILTPFCREIVVAGAGELPSGKWQRVKDAPECAGPLSGILAVSRYRPTASLLVCACDMPDISTAAVSWLLEQRRAGDRALVPKTDFYQPLFAFYDRRMGSVFEAMSKGGKFKLRYICGMDNVRIVHPPSHLRSAWNNINYPHEVFKSRR
ncbi:molybdenum cofactor guanylyltransferase [Desulfobacterota bacterium M19]